ncbi:hypothetical protein QF038_001887 [Pseudarthrobacter sp. W1I19]|uniref:DUF6308 family protein n=1 Tax=Pseudarthrobacter sp. W1I19 TaxID=3042288 RepID=UPI002788E4D3|nr:DUF6308 family protein [Pseudarthrobacter sp. W1I19]MDQ0923379.1 hypothetical protein [Pseudarthrobacter sp. W1I19]
MTTTNINIAGHTIAGPLKTLTEYSRRYAGTLLKYDFGDKGDPNILTADEIWTTRVIHSRFTRAEQSELEKRSTSWRENWAAVASTARIEDADPAIEEGQYDAMQKLYSLITDIHGVSWAKASKVLHFKRPHLFPILDSRLMELYRAPALAAAKHYEQRGFKRMYWGAIRNDVVANKDALAKLRQDLANQDADINRLSDLSDLRILDILSWSR